MKIKCPINKVSEVGPLAEAGADEFYCGVLTTAWYRKFSNLGSPNRRDSALENLASFGQLREIVEEAHRHHVPVSLTLNSPGYCREELDILSKELGMVEAMGVDHVIVADVQLLALLKQRAYAFSIHASTGCNVFNAEAAKFFADLGCSRIIFPRQATVEDIRAITSGCPGMEFECFYLNEKCQNIDGYCTFMHTLFECKYPSVFRLLQSATGRAILHWLGNPFFLFAQRLGYKSAIACCMDYETLPNAHGQTHQSDYEGTVCESPYYNLAEVLPYISVLKIVGRLNHTEKKISDVRFARSRIESLLKTRDANPARGEPVTLTGREKTAPVIGSVR